MAWLIEEAFYLIKSVQEISDATRVQNMSWDKTLLGIKDSATSILAALPECAHVLQDGSTDSVGFVNPECIFVRVKAIYMCELLHDSETAGHLIDTNKCE